MIAKGKNALIIFKNCLNKFFEVMYGGFSKRLNKDDETEGWAVFFVTPCN